MQLNKVKPAAGAKHAKKRVGRGIGCGLGKTAGRGHKGQKARAGGFHKVGFEGGQMPLQRRLPKLPGFTSRNRIEYDTVNVRRIDAAFADGDEVTPDALRAKGLIRRGNAPVKILGDGELSKKVTVAAHAFTATARSKVEAGGGTVRELPRRATGETAKP